MKQRIPTRDAAQGRWRGILLTLGIPDNCLASKTRNGPCPMCGGKDRFRMDDKEGRGTWICNRCGAGDGFQLAEQFLGLPFAETAKRIDAIVNNEDLPAEKPTPEIDGETARRLRLELWRSGTPIEKDTPADRYFAHRGLDEVIYPTALRFAPAARDGDGGVRPCILAAVTDPEGVCVAVHRTFLRSDGMGKAEMASPRKLTPGKLPDGSCVRLSPPGEVLGVAEGIETAFAASALYEIPVWACINATMLEKWTPPPKCREVAIFGDHDDSFTGHAASYALARKLKAKGFAVTVHMAPKPETDWLDEYLARKGVAA